LGALPDSYNDCCGLIGGGGGGQIVIPRDAIVNWIYGLQALPTLVSNDNGNIDDFNNDTDKEDRGIIHEGGGFRGGTYLGPVFLSSDDDSNNDEQQQCYIHPYDHTHLAMTYCALCTLLALNDDLSRINRTGILQTLQGMQHSDGSFSSISTRHRRRRRKHCNTTDNKLGEENVKKDMRIGEGEVDEPDLRFVYTAAAIRYLLLSSSEENNNTINDHDIDVNAAISYIYSCISYDGAFGLNPGREGHGGSTFCGVAALYLLGALNYNHSNKDNDINKERILLGGGRQGWKENLVRWCVSRQRVINFNHLGMYTPSTITTAAAGVQGRPNKPEDTCYSYWIGGTLHLLNEAQLLDGWALREYVLNCQSPYGGFGKVQGSMPDLLHSFYSLAWLSLSNEQDCCDNDYVVDKMKCVIRNNNSNDCPESTSNNYKHLDVEESIRRLSKLDCALGMCAKRVRRWEGSLNL
jgi:geranylgeranyl transferase type-1 subunit beta